MDVLSWLWMWVVVTPGSLISRFAVGRGITTFESDSSLHGKALWQQTERKATARPLLKER